MRNELYVSTVDVPTSLSKQHFLTNVLHPFFTKYLSTPNYSYSYVIGASFGVDPAVGHTVQYKSSPPADAIHFLSVLYMMKEFGDVQLPTTKDFEAYVKSTPHSVIRKGLKDMAEFMHAKSVSVTARVVEFQQANFPDDEENVDAGKDSKNLTSKELVKLLEAKDARIAELVGLHVQIVNHVKESIVTTRDEAIAALTHTYIPPSVRKIVKDSYGVLETRLREAEIKHSL